MKKILVVIGTRPEAIKMAPVLRALRVRELGGTVKCFLCVTGQHRELLDQVLSLFGLVPDFDLDLMKPSQDVTDITCGVLIGLRRVLKMLEPDIVLVHGDTTTTFSASLASYYERIPIAHVEAGLRTSDPYAPWPEEMNRRLTGAIASIHFAPTERARQNLLGEGIAANSIDVTGNTVIDALFVAANRLECEPDVKRSIEARFDYLDRAKKLILVTGHRRENFGEGMANICRAIARLASRNDLEIVYPVHPNPNVQAPVTKILGGLPSVHLISPQDYLPFVYLMIRSTLILTDSGGIQEEAPSLGKPVLVMRSATERPEAVEAGTVRLVGSDCDAIVDAVNELLGSDDAYVAMARAHNPYGDGTAADRIVERLMIALGDPHGAGSHLRIQRQSVRKDTLR